MVDTDQKMVVVWHVGPSNNRYSSYQAFNTNIECTAYYEDVPHMLVNGIYNTAGDGNYESFHLILKLSYHNCDNDRELAFDTKDNTARDNNKRTTH